MLRKSLILALAALLPACSHPRTHSLGIHAISDLRCDDGGTWNESPGGGRPNLGLTTLVNAKCVAQLGGFNNRVFHVQYDDIHVWINFRLGDRFTRVPTYIKLRPAAPEHGMKKLTSINGIEEIYVLPAPKVGIIRCARGNCDLNQQYYDVSTSISFPSAAMDDWETLSEGLQRVAEKTMGISDHA